jgi:hypothetical protein
MKRLFLLAALTAGNVMAQSADISGTQLLSGDADARLQALAREASSGNRKLIISAPEYWHEMILEQVRRGGGDGLQVEVRDSFAEAVMVRSDELVPAEPVAAVEPEPVPAAVAPPPPPPPAAPAPRPAPVVAAAPAPRPAPTPAPVVQQAAPRPVAAPVQAAPPPAVPRPVAGQPAPRPAAPAPSPAPAPAPAPAPSPAQPIAATSAPAAPASTAGSAQAEVAAIKRRLEASLNDGERITRSISQSSLEPKDVLYVRGEVIAVQRRDSLRSQLYWLDGGIELMRVELRETGPNRYVVVEPIRNVDSPRLRAVRVEERELFTAGAPDKFAAERSQMERRYGSGKSITATITPTQLRQRDVVYIGDDLSVVVRVSGLELERYWLVGGINLGRAELLKDGNNKYRVVQDIRQ